MLRRINQLELFLPRQDSRQAGFTTIQLGPLHRPHGDFIPSPGQNLGYFELNTIELEACFSGLARDEPVSRTIEDFAVTARLLEALPRRRWVDL